MIQPIRLVGNVMTTQVANRFGQYLLSHTLASDLQLLLQTHQSFSKMANAGGSSLTHPLRATAEAIVSILCICLTSYQAGKSETHQHSQMRSGGPLDSRDTIRCFDQHMLTPEPIPGSCRRRPQNQPYFPLHGRQRGTSRDRGQDLGCQSRRKA